MSSYVINKFLRAVEMSNAEVEAYVRDPRAYVEAWVEGASPVARWADNRDLAPAAVDAIATRDFESLYALGAHPYLLWHFTEAVFIPEEPWPALVERYRAAVSEQPSPDLTA